MPVPPPVELPTPAPGTVEPSPRRNGPRRRSPPPASLPVKAAHQAEGRYELAVASIERALRIPRQPILWLELATAPARRRLRPGGKHRPPGPSPLPSATRHHRGPRRKAHQRRPPPLTRTPVRLASVRSYGGGALESGIARSSRTLVGANPAPPDTGQDFGVADRDSGPAEPSSYALSSGKTHRLSLQAGSGWAAGGVRQAQQDAQRSRTKRRSTGCHSERPASATPPRALRQRETNEAQVTVKAEQDRRRVSEREKRGQALSDPEYTCTSGMLNSDFQSFAIRRSISSEGLPCRRRSISASRVISASSTAGPNR